MHDRLGKYVSNPSKHHTIRLGDGGHDIPENIMILEQSQHDLIHCMLDMGGKCHSKAIRSYNKVMNGKYIVTPDAIKILHDMQMRYFDNIGKLPENIRKMHEIVIGDLVDVMEDKWKTITGHEWESDRKTFHQGHERYMMIEKEITVQISNALKKMYFI